MLLQHVRRLLQFLAISAAVGLTIPLLYIYSDRFYKPEDVVKKQIVADSLNAYDIYDQAGLAMSPDWLELEKLSNGTLWRQSLVDSVILQSDSLSEVIIDANERPYCYKYIQPDYRTRIPSYFSQIRLVKTFVVRMKNCIHHERYDDYLKELETSLNFVNKFDYGSTNTVQRAATIAMYKLVYYSILDAFRSDKMESDVRSQTLDIVKDYRIDSSGFARAMKFEAASDFNLLDAIDSTMSAGGGVLHTGTGIEVNIPASSTLINKWQFSPNRTKRFITKFHIIMIRNAGHYPSQWDVPEHGDIEIESIDEYANSLASFFNPNWQGEVFATMLNTYDQYYVLYSSDCELKFMHACLSLEDAMIEFRRSTGSTIASLEELVPEFIESVPLDPFNGQKVKFDARKGLFYSVGPDLIDSLGSESTVLDESLSRARGRLGKYDLVHHIH